MVETIQHYDARTKTFAQPVDQKVRKLLELGKISKVTDGIYQCLPIPGYNITTYTIKEHFGQLICNCQRGRKGLECSHVRAVRIYQEQTENVRERQHSYQEKRRPGQRRGCLYYRDCLGEARRKLR